MATCKKFENQATKQILVASVPSGGLVAGDLFTYTPSTQAIAKITKASEVETAVGAGKEVYLVGQGDNVTDKAPSAYKNYNVSKAVAAGTNKVVVAYPVTNATNIEGFEEESK